MRRELLHDIALKTLSVAIAVGLWLAISGEKTAERSLTVPMELRNFPRDLELTTDLVSSVQVRIRATPGIIHSLEAGEISAQVDLAGVREGERIIQLVPEDVRAPFGVRVVKVTPATLTMMFENGQCQITPWPIEYATYNDPKRNAFFREAAQLKTS